MPQRFTVKDRQAYDLWQKEELALVNVPSTHENLERVHVIFSFQSNLLQNIVTFTPGHFQISVLTQPFTPSAPEALSRLSPPEAGAVRKRALALLHAAREYRLDFIDFSRVQVLPAGGLRFGWRLEPQAPPSCASFAALFQGNHPEAAPEFAEAPPLGVETDFLCRREDFACHRLMARSPRDLGAGANARIRINTKFPWQEAVARDNLFHNLNDAETLLLNVDLEDTTLGRRLAALCAVEDAAAENPAALTQEFRLFLKKSVFRESVLIVRNLARREDDRLLRFLFESEDIPGLTVVLFGDPTSCGCDLEFNEDPQNLMAGGSLPQPRPARPSEPDEDEKRLLASMAADRPTEVESCLRDLARRCPGRRISAPAAEMLCRHLEQAAADDPALSCGVEVLIQGNCLEQADRVLATVKGKAPPWARLKQAHLAMRRRQYRELGELLAGMTRPGENGRDEWLYLNFIYHEKLSRKARADEYAEKIRSPYYRNLSLIQLSDRSIYNREFVRARTQLAGVLDYFSAGSGAREEIAARSQMAKLLREEGELKEAETLYKTIYVQAEAEGLPLSSANAAVDLGNLYAETDDDFQAECWYRKASRLYALERSSDGQMLVNANLVNVLLAKGDWLQADKLLRDIRAWDEEKKLLDSSAIDSLNQAGLETLRHHEERALQLVQHAEAIFRDRGNRKGLGECAFLRARITGDPGSDPEAAGDRWLSADQRSVCSLLRLPAPASGAREAEMLCRLDAIASRKMRFEALRLLLKKHRRHQWLERFMKMAWDLSPRGKNYFFFEYWHMFFELAGEAPPAERREEFLAMHDFFTLNQRCLSPKLNRWRQACEDSEKNLRLFDDVRLVEQHRQWRLPADFFNSFCHEIGKAAPVDWLVMDVHEKRRPLFRFASSAMFPELGDEMLRRARGSAPERNHDRQEVQRIYRSPERVFYPFASTQLLRWPIDGDILACLVIASRDGALRFQDLNERCRETLRTFAQLFRNFLKNEYRIGEKLDFIVGSSQQVQSLKRLIAQVAKVDFSLLISGESGCGKELVARAVHLLGPRAGQPFISVNAAAIPDTLLEAELFGFRKGAFSGAGEQRVGLLEAADRGTLFLDEIADLPLALQAKLLRALQEKEIRRLGENRTIRIDVRLISASNRDLEELIRGKLFRADLFYRLQDLVIRIPPLRERREDIPQLIGHFLLKYGYPGQAPDKLAAIADLFRLDEFPGNVRELESKVKNMITFNPELALDPGPERTAFSWKIARQDFEKDLLRRTLTQQRGNRKRTAEMLGISRMALFNLLKKHGISP